jgi:hypothetical protein
MEHDKDTGGDVYSEELAEALRRGWVLRRRWYLAGANPRLEMELRREVEPGRFRGFQRSYTEGEIEMLTQEIVAGHLRELAVTAMSQA